MKKQWKCAECDQWLGACHWSGCIHRAVSGSYECYAQVLKEECIEVPPEDPRRGKVFRLLDAMYEALNEIESKLLDSGPESSRDEVGFDRSPQRDCCNARVTPAGLM